MKIKAILIFLSRYVIILPFPNFSLTNNTLMCRQGHSLCEIYHLQAIFIYSFIFSPFILKFHLMVSLIY